MTEGAAPARVGVFDSGVGGLSVAAELRRQWPRVRLDYLADQSWAPYGERSLEAVRARSFAVVEHLLERGAVAVVVACNTASAAALHQLRERHPGIPFVGMEPAVKPAAEQSDGGVVGVLATAATFQGALYASVVDRHAGAVRVLQRAGTGLVELIEAGVVDGPEVEELLASHLAPLLDAGIDTLVLGCTHYPFVAGAIRRIVGPRVTLIDPAPAVARQTGRVLAEHGIVTGAGPTSFRTTGDPRRLEGQILSLLGVTVEAEPAEVR